MKIRSFPFLCHGCRKVTKLKLRIEDFRQSMVMTCRKCGKRRRHAYFGRRPLTGLPYAPRKGS